MKKAKIILSAVAVLTIVGGALAFKANRGQGELFYAAPGNPTFTTAVGGPTYYSMTALASYDITALGGISTTFYQETVELAPGKIALTSPVLTRATFVGQ